MPTVKMRIRRGLSHSGNVLSGVFTTADHFVSNDLLTVTVKSSLCSTDVWWFAQRTELLAYLPGTEYERFGDWLTNQANFGSSDGNHDGVIDREELTAAAAAYLRPPQQTDDDDNESVSDDGEYAIAPKETSRLLNTPPASGSNPHSSSSVNLLRRNHSTLGA